jgi:hypothetical protein
MIFVAVIMAIPDELLSVRIAGEIIIVPAGPELPL